MRPGPTLARSTPRLGRAGGWVACALAAIALTSMVAGATSAGAAGERLPNDPEFPWQWALRNTGQEVNGTRGTRGADIDVTRAWASTTGSRSVVIALVDDGLSASIPDLSPNAWSNPGGVNGCPAGTHGYDVVVRECDPDARHYADHGNAMALFMGAAGDNGTGIAGVNWTTSIMGIAVERQANNQSLVNAAIDWAIKAKQAGVNVRVLNASWGDGLYYDQAMADAIAEAGVNGILVVAAAGNDGRNVDDGPYGQPYSFPCGYDAANVVCVAATDQNDQLWTGSSFGARSVDLAAPGVNLCSGFQENPPLNGCDKSGTSDATAIVSGAAALILADNPSLTVSQLKARILDNVRPVAGLEGKVATGGVLDVYCAMTNCRARTASSTPTTSPGGGGSGGPGGGGPPGGGGSGGNGAAAGSTPSGSSVHSSSPGSVRASGRGSGAVPGPGLAPGPAGSAGGAGGGAPGPGAGGGGAASGNGEAPSGGLAAGVPGQSGGNLGVIEDDGPTGNGAGALAVLGGGTGLGLLGALVRVLRRRGLPGP